MNVEAKAPQSTKLIVIALVISLIASSTMLAGAIYLRVTEEDRLRAGLVEGCQKNGNPLRAGLREEKQAEILEAEHPDPKILDALHLTTQEAVELSQAKIEKLQEDITTRYAPVNCQEQYK